VILGDPHLHTATPADFHLLWWLPGFVVVVCAWLQAVTP